MLRTDAINIWRAADGDYHVEWKTSDPNTRVTVEPLGQLDGVEAHHDLEQESRARFTGLPVARRHYFRLCDQFGIEVIAAERWIRLQGTPNFRDFGGYYTAKGRQVKWGLLFRSGQLSRLTKQDIELLASLELDLICDFRREDEQEGDPSRLPEARLPKVLSLPITPGSNADFFEQAGEGFGGREAMFAFMIDINRDFAVAQTATYARMFREILEVSDARFLVHCAAGKDRTGFAAAMVQLALGVPRGVVMHDYLLTGQYFSPNIELERIRKKYQMDLPADSILPMLEVHEDYLSAALVEIDNRYSSIEDYLAEELGVGPAELAELRGRYLV